MIVKHHKLKQKELKFWCAYEEKGRRYKLSNKTLQLTLQKMTHSSSYAIK